ncbi:MAG: ABC transporter ATP-binding protein [Spirochaetales bacterium]|nr:ABC transporter ATP-binding protein [Spirochaetales bacterium]
MNDAVGVPPARPGNPAGASRVLEVREVRKVFRTGSEDLTVLAGVSFSVEAGSTVVITGESGCGKSTLLQLVGGLDTVSSGSIVFRGQEITRRSESQLMEFRNRTLGFIFQFHYLLKDFTALENVAMPAAIGGSPRVPALRRARELLARVGLAARAEHFPVELSGGERQRVAVARALMNDPELILADEPTGNLDERNSEAVQQLLFGLVRDYRKTMILVTHAAELSVRGDVQYLLEHGRLRLR